MHSIRSGSTSTYEAPFLPFLQGRTRAGFFGRMIVNNDDIPILEVCITFDNINKLKNQPAQPWRVGAQVKSSAGWGRVIFCVNSCRREEARKLKPPQRIFHSLAQPARAG